ncbi:MAG: tetratricopeptide repeat protein [Albidovulum sp.]|nr:tetratricopeptide repeat protein [Albidovulum sp.]MDE0531632.1 tetratricopeptide repeat protein [Albidovulum sp.]
MREEKECSSNSGDYPFLLNDWRRPITTSSERAQIWFDRGLNWIYGFNHEEAINCFEKSLEFDPRCAMAWWGISYAAGPFYNRPWDRQSKEEISNALPKCYDAAMRANSLAEGCTRAERDLIRAILKRYPSPSPQPVDTLNAWHGDFAESMRRVYANNPHDLDIASLCVEASITRTPRQMWDIRTGEPMPGADICDDVGILNDAIRRNASDGGPQHPALLHLLIHAIEMSNAPESAMYAADKLRDLARDEGHLHHMATHIYTLCGDYSQSVAISFRAIRSNEKYEFHEGDNNFYTTSRCHDLHQLMHASMFLGHFRHAMFAANRIIAIAKPELIGSSAPFIASILDGYSAMRTHVLVRFGKWRELINVSEPDHSSLMPVRSAMRLYGAGIAHAARGEIEEAEIARKGFMDACSRISSDSVLLNNRTQDVLNVGEAMLEGEIAYRKKNWRSAFSALRRAVELDDNLNFTEPWAWMHPPRHALGALLAEQERYGEAEIVYRQDLGYDSEVPRCRHHPDNVWALHGLLECVRQRKHSEIEIGFVKQRLDLALSRTDGPIYSSCACRKSRVSDPNR